MLSMILRGCDSVSRLVHVGMEMQTGPAQGGASFNRVSEGNESPVREMTSVHLTEGL